MQRKLIQQGGGGFTIYLPKEWADKNKLKKGDIIGLEEQGNKLVLDVKQRSYKDKKQAINVSDFSPLVNRVILALYVKGVDELEMLFNNPKDVSYFQKTLINELLGFEIVQQSNNKMLIRNIAEPRIQDIDELIKRIFFILNSMAQELIECLETRENLQPVIEIDSSVNRFVNFCHRILNTEGYKEFKKTPQMYSIVSVLEEIGDVYKAIALESKKNNLSKNQLSVLKDIRNLLDSFKSNLFGFKKEAIVEFAKLYEKIKSKLEKKDPLDFYLFQLNELIVRMNNDLLAISI